jgi:hypothetical protein
MLSPQKKSDRVHISAIQFEFEALCVFAANFELRISMRLFAAAALSVSIAGPVMAGEAPVTAPWPDRAEVAAREFVLANAQQIANSIQRTTHPAGRRPELTNLDFSRVEDRLLARIAVAWSDASARRGYAAWVYWEFGELGHVRAQIISHTLPAKIGAESAARIEDLFREKIYPAVMRGVGPSKLH